MIKLVNTGENIHPSLLPENAARTQLHQCFHKVMMPQLREVLGTGSCYNPQPGFEKAWRIFLGANISGKLHFVCHIVEDLNTALAYNCVDSTRPDCPVLLYGEPFYIKSEAMQMIRDKFPAHHCGNVPFQMALAIFPMDPTAVTNFNQSTLDTLLNDPTNAIFTSDFYAVSMEPSGTLSLSFKRDEFPLQFWTHSSRSPVIFTALEIELKKIVQDADLVSLYENACKLENGLGEIENTRTKNEKDLKAKENGLAKATISLENIVNNSQMPVEKKDKLIKEKTVNIELLNKEIGEHKNEDNRLLAALVEQKKAIDNFKKQNKERLPNSYTDATFQIAFDITFSDNSVVYKQYNGETGEFELSQNPDRDIRFQNAMHIPYF